MSRSTTLGVAHARGDGPWPSAFDLRKRWCAERDALHPWMKERKLVMAGINDAINANFDASLKRWKAAKYAPNAAPTFHSRRHPLSVTWTYIVLSNRHVNNRTVTLPQKMGTARLGDAIRFPGEIKKTTFSFEGGKWYASFLIAHTPPKPEPAPAGTAVGVDVGVVQFASLSNGTQYKPAMDHAKELEKLEKLQRALSRMEGPIKGQRRASKNWLKQLKKVQKQQARMANIRRNYTERVSLDLATQFETVAIEDLRIKNMTASAKGDEETPGKRVAQKAGLNRSILNGGFHQFRTRLEAKVSARGGTVIAVNPAYTSQTCPACGHVSAENRPSQEVFACTSCGYSENADIVAAQNILARALSAAEA